MSKNFKYLDDLIHSQRDEIVLDDDVILEDSEVSKYLNGIKIDTARLIIDGNNHTIDGKSKTRIFNIISGDEITIKNVTLKNAHSDNGGAILNESRLYLKNCRLINNYSKNKGGAITNNAFLSIRDCRFKDNASQSSGSVAYNSKNSSFECRFSEFSSNISKMSAGVIYCEKNTDIMIGYSDFHDEDKNILICHNLYAVDWTMVDVYQNGSVIEGSFIDNSVFRGADFKTLAELINDSGNMVDLEQDFELKASEIDLFKEGIEIARDNLVIDGKGHRIFTNAKSRIFKVTGNNVTFKNIEFFDGKSENGGAIHNCSDSISFENCKFEELEATRGGAIYSMKGNIDIKNCEFDVCMADGFGGAIHLENGNLKISDSEFTGNEAQGGGGAIYSKGENVIAENSEFTSNRAPNGGVFCVKNCDVKNCIFENNYSRSQGAVVCDVSCPDNDCGFHFRDCEFRANSVNYEMTYSSFGAPNIHLHNCKLSDELFEREYGVSKDIGELVIFPRNDEI